MFGLRRIAPYGRRLLCSVKPELSMTEALDFRGYLEKRLVDDNVPQEVKDQISLHLNGLTEDASKAVGLLNRESTMEEIGDVMRICASCDDWKQAVSAWDQFASPKLRRRSTVFDMTVAEIALFSLQNLEEWSRVFEIIQELEHRDLPIGFAPLSIAIQASRHFKDVERLMRYSTAAKDLEDTLQGMTCQGAVLEALVETKEVDRAVEIFRLLLENGVATEPAWMSLLEVCGSTGNWAYAIDLFQGFVELNQEHLLGEDVFNAIVRIWASLEEEQSKYIKDLEFILLEMDKRELKLSDQELIVGCFMNFQQTNSSSYFPVMKVLGSSLIPGEDTTPHIKAFLYTLAIIWKQWDYGLECFKGKDEWIHLGTLEGALNGVIQALTHCQHTPVMYYLGDETPKGLSPQQQSSIIESIVTMMKARGEDPEALLKRLESNGWNK